MRKSLSTTFAALIALVLSASAGAQNAPNMSEGTALAEEAYIYGFPMIAAYKALYQFNVDKSSGQYKAGFNEIWNDAHVFTPQDTAIVTPNSDTPYSMVQADLRAEPIVLCVPEVEKGRYYAVQLADMYSFNYGYIGSRATGNGPGLARSDFFEPMIPNALLTPGFGGRVYYVTDKGFIVLQVKGSG
jgi:hypothetical protein